MDTMELRSGKILEGTVMRGDSEDEFKEEVLASLEGYAVAKSPPFAKIISPFLCPYKIYRELNRSVLSS